jgi:hypothetical protein
MIYNRYVIYNTYIYMRIYIYLPHCQRQAGPDVAERMLNQGGHFYVCGSARQVPEDIYTAMKEVRFRWNFLGCFWW